MNKKNADLLLVIFGLFFFLLHYPFLAVFDSTSKLGGIPTTIIYIFLVWIFLIIAGFTITRRSNSNDDAD